MRVLGPVVQVSVLPVSNTGHYDAFRGRIAAQLVGKYHARTPTASGPQQLAKEPHGRNDYAILIDSAPEIMPHATDLQEHLVQIHLSPVRARRLLRPRANGVYVSVGVMLNAADQQLPPNAPVLPFAEDDKSGLRPPNSS